jgi:hypothetical protein
MIKLKKMKYISLTATVLLLFAFNNLFAQQSLPAGKPVKTGNEWKMPGDALDRAKKFTDLLKTNIGLDDATSKKIFSAYLGNTKAVDEIPMLPISDEEKAARQKANKATFDETLKGILSPAQFDKYLKMEADMKSHK